MAHQADRLEADPILLHPWVLLGTGFALAIIGFLLSSTDLHHFQFFLATVGVVFCIAAAARKLQILDWNLFPERLELSATLAVGGLAALVSWYGGYKEWDSVRMGMAALAVVGLVAAVVVLLPQVGRRIAISFLILFHFAGILTAITSIDPPNNQGPWVAKQLWTRVYRPYLPFLFMSNAYHFYSPDPGPPSLMWFAIHYSDGTYRWVKMPDRRNSPVGMHYQRLLALPEHAYHAMGQLPYSRLQLTEGESNLRTQIAEAQELGPLHGHEAEYNDRLKRLNEEVQKYRNARSWEEILDQRQRASGPLYKPPIPWITNIDMMNQYRQPNDMSKETMASLGKRMFHTAPPADDSSATVRSVKVYRITHQVITPQELAKGMSPLDKTKYIPFFMGEFDGEGKLLNTHDPFLYWYLPIVKVPPTYPVPFQDPVTGTVSMAIVTPAPSDWIDLDCLELHARGIKQTPQDKGNKP